MQMTHGVLHRISTTKAVLALCLGLAACGGPEVGEPGQEADDRYLVDAMPDTFDAPSRRPVIVEDILEADLSNERSEHWRLREEKADEDAGDDPVGDPLVPAPIVSEQRGVGPRAEHRTYRVLHWNIAGGKVNGCRTKGITRAVRRYVKDRNIDFVGLNEVCHAQHKAIRKALRALWGKSKKANFSAFVGDGVNRIVGNSVFSRWNLKEVTKRKVGEDQFGDRNLLCGQVRNRPHLRFCSVHLSPADSKASVQMERVRKRIEAWWVNKRDTVILSGDLNLQANHPGLNRVYAPGANTPNNPNNVGRYREVDDADPHHCLGFGQRSGPNSTGGPCREGGKIDFIFARRNRIVEQRYGGRTLNIPNDCPGKCSDHRAVVGQYRLRVRLDD